MSNIRYFVSSLWITFAGLVLAGWLGYYYTGTVSAIFETILLVSILSALEISLSFDNAVVNATILKKMTPLWRHRFLTWGMLIAVFIMRLLFPLIIVGIVAKIGPIEALLMAALKPTEYATIMLSAHVPVAAFGGTFLLMVALTYFFDVNKDVHWIKLIESPLSKLGRMEAIELGIAMISIYGLSTFLPPHEAHTFIIAGIWGLITFIAVDGIGAFLKVPESEEKGANQDIHKTSAALFMYLEILDASFSFDGVVGAFALTNNLFIIAIGLSIGAMFVRSLTIMLVDKGTLSHYRYLEHGAFYAIGALAAIMFVNTFYPVPELITGLVGGAFLALSLWSSIRHNRCVKRLKKNSGEK
jgi:hypothetical protein